MKNEVAKGLADIEGVRIDPPGMGGGGQEGVGVGGEEKKDEGNDSLKVRSAEGRE